MNRRAVPVRAAFCSARKCSASSTTSSPRSRSGGRATWDDVEAVEEVLAQLAGGHRLLDADSWWRRGRARRPVNGCGPADARDGRDVSSTRSSRTWSSGGISVISSRKQRPLVRALEVPLVLPVGAGEAAALVAEELALDQVRGDGAAVHGHEGLRSPRRLRSWMVCATTSLPVPVSPEIRMRASLRRHALDEVVDLLHRRRRRRRGRPNRPSLRSSPRSVPISPFISTARVEGGEGDLDPREVDRLRQVVDGAAAQHVDRGLDARVAGDQHQLGGDGALETLEQVGAAAVGQPQVGQHDVGGAQRDLRAGLLQACGRVVTSKPSALDQAGEAQREAAVVVDDRGPGRGAYDRVKPTWRPRRAADAGERR